MYALRSPAIYFRFNADTMTVIANLPRRQILRGNLDTDDPLSAHFPMTVLTHPNSGMKDQEAEI